MGSRAAYSIRCADGITRTINEDDLTPCLRMWGWATPEEVQRLESAVIRLAHERDEAVERYAVLQGENTDLRRQVADLRAGRTNAG